MVIGNKLSMKTLCLYHTAFFILEILKKDVIGLSTILQTAHQAITWRVQTSNSIHLFHFHFIRFPFFESIEARGKNPSPAVPQLLLNPPTILLGPDIVIFLPRIGTAIASSLVIALPPTFYC
ncbi:hypothetical protein CEXT_219531 [Caerostris extrusa]|uniref:Uncharacterized protein n=1 Tax=Caerostris extrusa TaxID=172846 RepID=A0AAV4SUU7_CAEEX|nr:hypothetical protein CEXT_219531 [Caerostris extrusa]